LELKATALERADGIATIWLDRPHRHNAWTGRMHTEYRWCLQEADRDPAVGAIVVTGRGSSFCVGGDAQALQGHAERGSYDAGTPDELARPGYGRAAEFDAAFAYHYGLSKPVVAALNGRAAGVGLALACFTDLRFAAAGARYSTAHGKLNLPAEFGLSWLLPRMVGLSRANDLLLTSRAFTAEEGVALGVFNDVFPAEEVLTRTYEYVRSLLANVSPGSLQQTRWQIYGDLHRSAAESVVTSEALVDEMMGEADYREGVAAFVEKRPPRWHGRTKV